MTAARLILLAAGGSALLLAAAFAFQFLGWQPCAMCLWQRWPHAAAIGIGVLALAVHGMARAAFAGLGALAALTTAGIAAYHSGVERGWWEGPASCTGTGGGLGNLSGAELVPGASDAPALVLCDSFTPFLAGLSMANWNLIWSLLLAVIWIAAIMRAESDNQGPRTRAD